jgi:hypothetical protein
MQCAGRVVRLAIGVVPPLRLHNPAVERSGGCITYCDVDSQ